MRNTTHLLIGPLTAAALAVFAIAFSVGVSPARAQDRVDIRFEPGASGTTINGTIIGDEYIDYVLRANAGQQMNVTLTVTGTNGNGSAYFNILPGRIMTVYLPAPARAVPLASRCRGTESGQSAST